MSEQKQSLADFVFENKDKMPDNVYKILMEQYAKQEQQPKGFVEVEYYFPKVVKWGANGHKLVYEKRKAITQKYDDKFDVNQKLIKIGRMLYSRIVKDAEYCDYTSHDIELIGTDDDDAFEMKYNGENTYLHTSHIFVLSVKDL
jgi:hypothetical protein